MSSYSINSPFSGLGISLFNPAMTGTASAGAVNDISRAYNPTTLMKPQSINNGTSRNVFVSASKLGGADAMRQAAPVNQQFQDQQANAEWALGRANANEGFANSMLSRLYNNYLTQNNPNIAISQAQNAMSVLPRYLEMFGNMSGTGF